jgi:hypothetical protein
LIHHAKTLLSLKSIPASPKSSVKSVRSPGQKGWTAQQPDRIFADLWQFFYRLTYWHRHFLPI